MVDPGSLGGAIPEHRQRFVGIEDRIRMLAEKMTRLQVGATPHGERTGAYKIGGRFKEHDGGTLSQKPACTQYSPGHAFRETVAFFYRPFPQ